jgi:hypothetical protein
MNVVSSAAAQEVAKKTDGPVLMKKYFKPHVVPEEGIKRITDMLRSGHLFRYGGNDEGSLQVCASSLTVNQYPIGRPLNMRPRIMSAITFQNIRWCLLLLSLFMMKRANVGSRVAWRGATLAMQARSLSSCLAAACGVPALTRPTRHTLCCVMIYK